MEGKKCLTCFEPLEQITVNYNTSGVAYRCGMCEVEYTTAMYKTLEFQMGLINKHLMGMDPMAEFPNEVKEKNVFTFGKDSVTNVPDKLNNLLNEDVDTSEVDDIIAAFEKPIEEV